MTRYKIIEVPIEGIKPDLKPEPKPQKEKKAFLTDPENKYLIRLVENDMKSFPGGTEKFGKRLRAKLHYKLSVAKP